MSLPDEVIEYENIRNLLFAIAELHHNLGVSFNSASKKQEELWPVDRNGLAMGLIALAMFCERLEKFDCYTHVFNEFSSVLADLDYGIVHPVLTIRGRKGSKHRPQEPTDIWCSRCRVAIAVKYLMSTGRKKSEIAVWIEQTRKYHGLNSLVHKGQRAKMRSSIITWYEEFAKGGVKNQEARDLYRTFMHLLGSSRKLKTLSTRWLEWMADRQLTLAAKFKPITKEEVLSSARSIEPKRISARPVRRAARHRGN
jgi:hypothetical protein